MTSPLSRHFVSQRLKLHFVEWGDAAAPPIILVHGGRDHCRSWDWTAQRLVPGWRVIAVDLRGHGDSDSPVDGRSPMYAYVGDMFELIRQHTEGPVPIVAHSFGAKISLHFAGTYPERVSRLVAIEGLEDWPSRLAQWETMTMAQRLRQWAEDQRALGEKPPRSLASVEDAAARLMARHKNLTPEQGLHLARHGVRRLADGRYEWKYDINNWSPPPYDIPRAETFALRALIECPVLLMHGAKSHIPPPHPHLAHFKNVRTSEFAKSGHFPQHDELDLFVERVRAFVGEPAPRAA